ncbi:MAG: Sigma-54 dependent response regulator [Myxococcales bacterium]|nr:Sigma-54 dependent response regulator [Myxococcales bacterium]
MKRHERTTTSAEAYVDERPSESSWYLIVSGGGSEMSSRVVPIHDTIELTFGRVDACEIKVDHESVSRRHARVRRRADHVQVEDLGSRNGTLVNGAAVTGPRRLAAGDVIAIGPATAIVATSTVAKRTRQVATVNEFEDRFDAEVDRAVRYQRPLGLVMLRIEGPVDLMTEHVETLLGQLRRMDVVAEYGAEELALVLPESDREATLSVARRSAAVPVGLTARAGTASFPEDGSHVGELIGMARDRLRGVDPESRPASTIGHVVVADPLMEQVMALAKRVAPSGITVLVAGETGVGKEVVAESVHRLSPRRAGPFVRLNCASLSETLVESELFGHEKGAFTGAISAKPGFFEAASTGTLFLDEIGELPVSTQAKLLRVLEQRKVVRVGGTQETPVDVRLVCATNRDLESEVTRGRFRQDLYFRISAFVIPVPPLRDRRTEIEPLALHFARELSPPGRTAAISPEVLEVFDAYAWPGNVRELRNVIERAVVMSGGTRIEPHHLPDRLLEKLALASTSAPQIDVRQRVADVERESVLDALEATHNNQTKAAKKLGISRFALIRMMEKHDLKKR